NALLQDRFIDLIRQLFDDELRAPVVGLFELDTRANQYPPAARRIRMLDVVDDQAFAVFFEAHDQAPGRKIGAFDELQQVVDGGLGIVDQVVQRIDDFAQIVRWHIRRHTDRDTRRAVADESGKAPRPDQWLLAG